MKNYIRVFWLLFILIYVHVGSHAQSTEKNKIHGLWVVDTAVQLQNNPKNSERINKLDKKQKERYLETQKSRAYVFFENGKFETSWVSNGSSQLVYGKWEINKKNELQVALEDNSILLYKITETKSHLILTSSVKDGSEERRLYLKRLDR